MELTQQQLKELLHYDPETGIFRWLVSTGSVKKFAQTGCMDQNKYCLIRINKVLHKAHRLAWLYMTGKSPVNNIDHKDGDPSNNKWSNLREATQKQNLENSPLSKANTSGYRGVYWFKPFGKWKAGVCHNRKNIHVGYFKTAEEANIAAIAKRAELFTHDTGRDQVTKTDSIVNYL